MPRSIRGLGEHRRRKATRDGRKHFCSFSVPFSPTVSEYRCRKATRGGRKHLHERKRRLEPRTSQTHWLGLIIDRGSKGFSFIDLRWRRVPGNLPLSTMKALALLIIDIIDKGAAPRAPHPQHAAEADSEGPDSRLGPGANRPGISARSESV